MNITIDHIKREREKKFSQKFITVRLFKQIKNTNFVINRIESNGRGFILFFEGETH